MRKPVTVERMYMDADGFFASCSQFKHPHLRGKPVGIVPMPKGSSCIIAASREAKALGVKNVMPLRQALAVCPDLVLWPQEVDLYRRCHNEMISELRMETPVDAVKSIDELTCTLSPTQRHDPLAVGRAIRTRMFKVFGPWLYFSFGYGANRLLAKMACKDGKPAGNLAWHPDDVEAHLLAHKLDDVPGIADGTLAKLNKAGIFDMAELLKRPMKELRALWGNLNGERMWLNLHGYDIQAQPSQRRQFGHGRIIPPLYRGLTDVKPVSRLLMTKAARRMRREEYRADEVFLGLDCYDSNGDHKWAAKRDVAGFADYSGILSALDDMWIQAKQQVRPGLQVFAVNTCLGDLSPMSFRQLDLLDDDDGERREQESLSTAMDNLNRRYGQTVVSLGEWKPPPGGFAGAKISYTRIPRREDNF